MANGGSDTSAPQTFTIAVNRLEYPPVVSGSSKTVLENASVTFSPSDFTSCYSDVNADSVLQTVEFTSLPADGTLTLAGVPVTVGQQISPADVSGLAYRPDSQFVGSDGFTWSASDGVEYAAEDANRISDGRAASDRRQLQRRGGENAVLAFSTADFANNFSAPGAGESLTMVESTPCPQTASWIWRAWQSG